MATDTYTMPMGGTETSLSPAEIEHALVAMWKSPAGEAAGDAQSALRVVLGNVLWLGTTEQMARVRSISTRVVSRYPCRLFLLEYDGSRQDPAIHAQVTAECFVPQPGAPPVCGEVVSLQFGPAAVQHLRGVVAPLLLPDVQTVLWENLGDVEVPALDSLQEYCDRTIAQVSLASKPARKLQKLVAMESPAFDLSWFRMASIREQVAAFFDDANVALSPAEIVHIRVGLVKRSEQRTLPELMGSLFVGWIGSKLGWKPDTPLPRGYRYRTPHGAVHVVCEDTAEIAGPVQNNLNQIDMTDSRGRTFHMVLKDRANEMDMWCDDGCGCHRHVMLSEFSEADALGAALNSGRNLEGFRGAAALAIPLLESLHP